MPADQSPTIVLVHGAWHEGAHLERLAGALRARGLQTLAPDLPGPGADGDLLGDAASLRHLLDGLSGPVLLTGHSYGGAVITQAAAGTRTVRRLIYLAAFMPDAGESVSALATGPDAESADLAAALRFHDDGTTTLDPDLATRLLYADCPPEVAAAAVDRLRPQSLATFTQEVTEAAWRTIPSTYVVCTHDRTVLPTLQRTMARRASEVVEIDTSHSPFLSRPEEVADLLAQRARAVAP